MAGDRVIGVDRRRVAAAGRVHRGRRAPPRDPRLEHGRGARERAPVRRDEAPARETDERAAELAIINSVQQGLAARARHAGDVRPRRRQDRARSSTPRCVDIAHPRSRGRPHPLPVHDRARRAVPGRADRDGRLPPARRCRRPGSRCSSTSDVEERGRGLRPAGAPIRESCRCPCSSCRSSSGGEVTGVISLQNLDREDAFSDGDVRLLTTLAASLSVALENARLFDETKRLLAETDERAAELAIINGVQQGLAAQTRHAGDVRPRRRQDPRDLRRPGGRHRDHRPRRGQIHFPYTIERGVAVSGRGDPAHRLPAARPRDAASRCSSTSAWPSGATSSARPASIAGRVPEVGAVRAAHRCATGVRASSRSRTSTTRTPSPSRDVRLLTTLAGSLSVALENARLFDETKRLLAETDERAAELAIINGVQQGLAARARHRRRCTSSSATGSARSSTPRSCDIAHLRPRRGPLRFPYAIERGVRFADEPRPNIGPRQPRDRDPRAAPDRRARGRACGGAGQAAVRQGEAPKAILWAPLIVAGGGGGRHLAAEPRPRARVRRGGRRAPRDARSEPERRRSRPRA